MLKVLPERSTYNSALTQAMGKLVYANLWMMQDHYNAEITLISEPGRNIFERGPVVSLYGWSEHHFKTNSRWKCEKCLYGFVL